MSFLNTVLKSIGSKDPPSPSTTSDLTKARSSLATQGAFNEKHADNTTKLGLPTTAKRKAEDASGGSKEKFAKTGLDAVPKVGCSSVSTLSKTPVSATKAAVTLANTPPAAHSGTSRPNLVSRQSKDSIKSPYAPKSDAEPTPEKEPKKGSYAEIMARAKANQAKPRVIGTISHKPKEKGVLSYKQELKLQKQARSDKKLGVVRDKNGNRASPADAVPRVGKQGAKLDSALPAKKPKPQPTYKGTMNPASVTAKAKEKTTSQTTRRVNDYAGTDDELDDEMEEDDGYGYDDEESDDMEAGYLDVEEEEATAAQAARKEDEEEARLEVKLKREKEERKRKMEQLAKKAKPQRY